MNLGGKKNKQKKNFLYQLKHECHTWFSYLTGNVVREPISSIWEQAEATLCSFYMHLNNSLFIYFYNLVACNRENATLAIVTAPPAGLA